MGKIITRLFNAAYRRVFGTEPTGEENQFAYNIGYFGVAYGIASVLGFAFQVGAGRVLEPTTYGEYAVVISIASILSILMLTGITTGMVRLNAAASDDKMRSLVFSSTYFLVLVFSLVFALVYYLFSPQLAQLFSVSNAVFSLAIIFAILLVFHTISTSSLQSLLKVKSLALFQVVYSVCLLVAFLLLVYLRFAPVNQAVLSAYIACALTAGIIVFTLRGFLSPKAISRFWMNRLMKYAAYGTMGVASGVILTSVDKILINRFLTMADVGIYQAYSTASLSIVAMAVTVFATIFFPTASKYPDKGAIFQRINKLVPYLIIIGFPAIIGLEFIVMKFYGSQYPINWGLMLLFAATSLVFGLYNVYAWLVSAHGLKGARITAFITLTMALINILLNILWIPALGVTGAILATGVSYLGALGGFLYKLKRGIKVEL